MKTEDDFGGLPDEHDDEVPKRSFCLWHRVAIYGCLALALLTLVVFVVSNLSSG